MDLAKDFRTIYYLCPEEVDDGTLNRLLARRSPYQFTESQAKSKGTQAGAKRPMNSLEDYRTTYDFHPHDLKDGVLNQMPGRSFRRNQNTGLLFLRRPNVAIKFCEVTTYFTAIQYGIQTPEGGAGTSTR